LYQLRRVVKEEYLPQSLRNVLVVKREPSPEEVPPRRKSRSPTNPELAYIVLSATCLVKLPELQDLLLKKVPYFSYPSRKGKPPAINIVTVPRFPPTSVAHAAEQSATLWPVTYNPNTSYGPNPAIVAQAQEEIESNNQADDYMAMAKRVGDMTAALGVGPGVGVVVVERDEGTTTSRLVAVAGDARWFEPRLRGLRGHRLDGRETGCLGHPEAHAVMRAIDFVAQKRRAVAQVAGPLEASNPINSSISSPSGPMEVDDETQALPAPKVSTYGPVEGLHIKDNYEAQLHHAPLTESESHYLSLTSNPNSLKPHGYLCLNLEFYITHEPCVMCSMALVHSRAGRVIYAGARGGGSAESGALRAESPQSQANAGQDVVMSIEGDQTQVQPPKYGLFWREDLNWRFNAWEWKPIVWSDQDDDIGWMDELRRGVQA
jgi:tRNA-specific adenosine deaminase 3